MGKVEYKTADFAVLSGYLRPGDELLLEEKTLSAGQRSFLRALCYWKLLEAVNSVPLSPEAEEAFW